MPACRARQFNSAKAERNSLQAECALLLTVLTQLVDDAPWPDDVKRSLEEMKEQLRARHAQTTSSSQKDETGDGRTRFRTRLGRGIGQHSAGRMWYWDPGALQFPGMTVDDSLEDVARLLRHLSGAPEWYRAFDDAGLLCACQLIVYYLLMEGWPADPLQAIEVLFQRLSTDHSPAGIMDTVTFCVSSPAVGAKQVLRERVSDCPCQMPGLLVGCPRGQHSCIRSNMRPCNSDSQHSWGPIRCRDFADGTTCISHYIGGTPQMFMLGARSQRIVEIFNDDPSTASLCADQVSSVTNRN